MHHGLNQYHWGLIDRILTLGAMLPLRILTQWLGLDGWFGGLETFSGEALITASTGAEESG
jgi:hypothetical protein